MVAAAKRLRTKFASSQWVQEVSTNSDWKWRRIQTESPVSSGSVDEFRQKGNYVLKLE
jgi:hypothetical protein